MAPATPPSTSSLGELVEALSSPYAAERYSSLTGESILIADLGREGPGQYADALAETERSLRELACPSVALISEDAPIASSSLLGAFDVTLSEDTDLDTICTTVAANPIASLGLVQLLRLSENLSIHEALIAESLVYSMLQTGPEFARWLETRKPATPHALPDEPAILLLRDGARLHMTMNRPERHNAFSTEMRDALVEALRVVVADPGIEEVIWRGAGTSFCSGGDLGDFGTLPDPATAHAVRSTRNPARMVARCGARIRTLVHGACVGAGMELPAFTGRVVARPDTWFWLPEVAMGLVPGAGGTASIPRRIGRQRTNLLALTARRLDVETALSWGLVDEISEAPIQ